MKQSDQWNQKNRIWIQFKQIGQGLFAAGISGALAVGLLLTACTGRPGEQPTVTDDDLTQPSTVQDVLEQDAGNGKNYAYHWDAGDIEATMAQREEGIQLYTAQIDERLAELENMTPEELAETGFDSIEQAREQYGNERQRQLDGLELERKYLEKQAALDPVVSPQEAANRAGVLFEELYGIDLSQDVLELSCRESEGDDIIHPDRIGALRPIWTVSREEAADGVLFSTSSFSCTMDGTTGEILFFDYTPSMQEVEERKALPYPTCFSEVGDGGTGYGRWNTEDASFAPMIEAAAQNLKLLLSGSALFGGAQVTDVSGEVTEFDDGINALWLNLRCDNGKSYRMQAEMPYDPFSTEGAGTPFPMRGFRVWNDTYQ